MKRNMKQDLARIGWLWSVLILAATMWASAAIAVPLPGGTLDPLSIPKYVQPLVIPPVMPAATSPTLGVDGAPAADYNIAVRQFQQQILPGGIWHDAGFTTATLPATPIWSYGPAEIPAADVAAAVSPKPLATTATGYFNYPAFTLEETSNVPNTVRWINDLKDPDTGAFREHLLTNTVDQTLHWANPPNANCVNTGQTPQTDCNTYDGRPYTGPVPIVTHVHGAHVNQESDGYPEAWWLPAASDIPEGYATHGTLYTQRNGMTDVQEAGSADDFDPVDGAAFYTYENTQPATTIWYHDHALGMTRLNVYAGPAGFYLVRGGVYDGGNDVFNGGAATLPGPAPVAGEDPNFVAEDRAKIREIPIVMQDRSFNTDGSLFYPATRSFFDTFTGPYIGHTDPENLESPLNPSDISPIWNPEAFFNTMVVNGTTWPKLDVAPAKYRFRLLNGCNSRFLNLSMFTVDPLTGLTTPVELPFYQIGGDQGFLPAPVEIMTGFITPVDLAWAAQLAVLRDADIAAAEMQAAKFYAKGNIAKGDFFMAKAASFPAIYEARLVETVMNKVAAPDPMQALLMAPAERADVIVDFSGLAPGTIVRLINTAPDAPFGGFPDIPADPATSGQVMQFVVNQPTVAADATAVSQYAFAPNAEVYDPTKGGTATVITAPRPLSLNEEESTQVCVQVDAAGNLVTVATYATPQANIAQLCAQQQAVPQAPKAALLGLIANDPTLPGSPLVGVPHLWKDPLTENPALNTTEFWDFYNLTVDGHPIHMHLVRYKIIHRQAFNPQSKNFSTLGAPMPALPTEAGMKDTVLTYPSEITRVQATFDLPGLYVWHCHIVEHEDNEMMRPFYVGTVPNGFPVPH